MSRMSNLDYTIRNWYKDHIAYIIATIVVLVLGLCIYVQADKDIKKSSRGRK